MPMAAATAEDRVRSSVKELENTAKAEDTAALSGVVTALTRITASDLFNGYFET